MQTHSAYLQRAIRFALMVAVLSGRILSGSAADGFSNWRPVLSSPRTGFVGVAAGAGRIVAVNGIGEIISWPLASPSDQSRFVASGPLRGITYGDGRFVAVGFDGLIVSSTNAVNWTSQLHPSAAHLTEVVFGNGVFVAMSSGALLRSTDGVNWIVLPRPVPWQWPGLFFGGGTFILTMRGTNLLSQDGLNWTPAPSGTAEALYTIGYGNGVFVAINHRMEVLTSPDAVTWTRYGKIEGMYRPGNIAEGNGYLVTVGGAGRAHSRDGIHWTVLPSNTTEYSVVFANGVFIAAGYEHVHQSGPVITVTLQQPGTLAISGAPDRSYRIESTDRLSAASEWDPQHEFVSGPADSTYTWTDPRQPAVAHRFYRVVHPE